MQPTKSASCFLSGYLNGLTFQTTFSHRLTCISSDMAYDVSPALNIAANPSSLSFSKAASTSGLGYSPISVCSEAVCRITPGNSCLAPTHICLCYQQRVLATLASYNAKTTYHTADDR